MNDFQLVEKIFLAAVELPAGKRAAFLETACAGDAELRAEIDSLLAFDSDKSRPLSSILAASAVDLLEGPDMSGVRIGPYQIERVLGHGGMGSVYLAHRADDQFRRNVAIKFIRRGMDTPEAVARFLRERQILADLNHPYIARLLDGGATESGIPYFVMEYVEGHAIHDYCARKNLGLKARCELFRKICDAVSYAHRSLVVHRDLKPSNILVRDNGTPALLDFGIARLIDDAAAMDRTRTALTMLMTPDYASPEQLRGKPTGTATDVYSLGVVLYFLLTGTRPFALDGTTPFEMARTVCEDEPPRPSSIAKRRELSGDLDNIILMALRKEPERRYSSVEQFSEDILRYLQGRPVLARESTFRYRAGKFVLRNRMGVVASAAAVAALLGGVFVSSWEAHRANAALRVAESQRARAEQEHRLAALSEKRAMDRAGEAEIERKEAENQRKEAEAQRQEAELRRAEAQKRVTDIVDLSRHSLFDVQGTLEHLPGALSARKDVITTTLGYLDKLAAGEKDDPAVLAMLVTGYTQTGDVLGLASRPNLGDTKGAMEAWQKGRRILARLQAIRAPDKRTLLQELGLHQRIGMLLEATGEYPKALSEYQAGLAVGYQLARKYPKDPSAVVQAGIIEHNLGLILTRLHDPSAGDHVRAEVEIYRKAVELDPTNIETRLGLSSAIGALGQYLVSQHKLAEALEQYRKSLELREAIHARVPNDGVSYSAVARGWLRVATTLGAPWDENLGDLAGAREAARKSVAIYENIHKAEPQDRKATGDLARALIYEGIMLSDLTELRRGFTMLTDLQAQNPKQVLYEQEFRLANQYLKILENLPGR